MRKRLPNQPTGNVLRERRIKLGLSQREVCAIVWLRERVMIHSSALSAFERDAYPMPSVKINAIKRALKKGARK